MTRVIVHPGFHKTGTTSLQSFLSRNEAALAPHMRLMRKRDFPNAARAAGRMARHPRNPFYAIVFATGFLNRLRKESRDDMRPLVISAEALCGAIPGTHGIIDYRHAVRIARLAVRLLRLRFGRGVTVTLLYTTRDEDSWRRSAHAHLVKRFPYTLDLPGYVQAFPYAPGFAPVLAALRQQLPAVEILDIPLKATANRRFGPADAVLDQLELPADVRARLEPVEPMNRSVPEEQTEDFRRMNQTTPDALPEKMRIARRTR